MSMPKSLKTAPGLSVLAAGLIALAGCAEAPRAGVARLSPEQLAAIPLPGPEQAQQATRLTQQADREAQEARAAGHRRELELQRWRAYEYERNHHHHWSLGFGHWHGHPRRFGWGAGYYFP